MIDSKNSRAPDPAPAAEAHDDVIDLTRLFYALIQRRRIVLFTIAFFFAMAMLYTLLAARVYEATSVVELHTRRPRIVGEEGAYVSEDAVSASVIADALNTHFHKMQSETVRQQVVRDLRRQAAEIPELGRFSDSELSFFLANRVTFTRVIGTYLVRLAVRGPSPEFAEALANTYARVVVEEVKNSTKLASIDAVQWLQEQITSYEQELLNNEAKVIAFRQKHNIDGLLAGKTASDQSLMAINEELVAYETRSATLRDMVATLEAAEASPELSGTLPSSIPRADIIQERLKAYSDAGNELKRLGLRYTERHPVIEQQQQVVDLLRGELLVEIGRARETAKADLALVNAYVQSIHSNKLSQIATGEDIQQRINAFNTDVIPLQRALEASDSSYKGLLARIEQARLSIDEDTSLLTVYEWARRPSVPVAPRTMIILAASLILGLGAGVGLALLIHLLQDMISTPYDIETELKQNLLGLIPHVEADLNAAELARISHTDTFSAFNEALASMRASLLTQGHRRSDTGWVIMLSSVVPQEGKTTVSCNLAISMTKTYGRVLLIDGDMRRPRLHDVFDIPRQRQLLMEVLLRDQAGDDVFATVPQPTDVERLHVTLGHPVPGVSPTEVLENGRFESFLNWARRNYDIILVDTPPLGAASDALVFGRMADDVVMVCRYNRSRKGALRQALKDLRKNRAPLTGLVLNDFKPELPGGVPGYSAYGYRYGTYAPAGESTTPGKAGRKA